jgi:hypothetical protein
MVVIDAPFTVGGDQAGKVLPLKRTEATTIHRCGVAGPTL